MLTLCYSIGFSILFALFMGFILRWYFTGKSTKVWHGISFIIRGSILVLWLPLIGVLSWQLFTIFGIGYLWFSWVFYDAMCNLLRPLPGNFFQRFFYSGTKQSGTGSWIDRLAGEYLPFIKLAFTIITIIGIIYLSTEL